MGTASLCLQNLVAVAWSAHLGPRVQPPPWSCTKFTSQKRPVLTPSLTLPAPGLLSPGCSFTSLVLSQAPPGLCFHPHAAQGPSSGCWPRLPGVLVPQALSGCSCSPQGFLPSDGAASAWTLLALHCSSAPRWWLTPTHQALWQMPGSHTGRKPTHRALGTQSQ